MHKRKVTKEGRVTIPIEYLERFRIKEDDFVEVTSNRQGIIIKKFKETNVCAITGKVSKNLEQIGDVFVSREGLELMKKKLEEMDGQQS